MTRCHAILTISVYRTLGSLADVPKPVKRLEESYDTSLVKLVDEYYWATVTGGHEVPDRDQLEEWLSRESGSAAATAVQ